MAGQTLSIAQMYALARKAGLDPARATVAAAVGMAESGGRTAVTSANPDGGVNVGVWQLDTKGKGAGHSVAELSDPTTNATVMAKGTSGGTDWSAWQTYTQGTYHQYLGQAQTAASSESSGGSGWLGDVLHGVENIGKDILDPFNLIGGIGGALSSLIGLPSQVTDFLSALEAPIKALMWLVNPSNWVRIIAGFFGVLLAGFGLYALAKAA
jgi:hypothetical protein